MGEYIVDGLGSAYPLKVNEYNAALVSLDSNAPLPAGSNVIGRISSADENQRILDSDDAITTINYADGDKDSVSSIETSSVVLGRKVTDTFDNSGATTLVLTRVVVDV